MSDRLSVVLGAMADARGQLWTDGGPDPPAAMSLLSLRGAGISLMVNGELRGTAGV